MFCLREGKLKLSALYWLGYGYFAALFLGLLALGGLLILLVLGTGRLRIGVVRTQIFLAILLFALGRGFFRAVRARVPEPGGIELRSEEAPALFQLIRSLSQELGAPKIDSVKLDLSFNAGVAEIPRWGALGRFRRYLVLGAP